MRRKNGQVHRFGFLKYSGICFHIRVYRCICLYMVLGWIARGSIQVSWQEMSAVQERFEKNVGDEFFEWFNAQRGTAYSFARRAGEAPKEYAVPRWALN